MEGGERGEEAVYSAMFWDCIHPLFLLPMNKQRLESQVNDMTELYQHEVSELQAQLNQMDSLTATKSQDLEDAVAECRSKVTWLSRLSQLPSTTAS